MWPAVITSYDFDDGRDQIARTRTVLMMTTAADELEVNANAKPLVLAKILAHESDRSSRHVGTTCFRIVDRMASSLYANSRCLAWLGHPDCWAKVWLARSV